MFTLLALPNQVITDVGLNDLDSDEIEEVLNRHVIGKKLESGDFFDGQLLETQIDDCFVHVTEIDLYKKIWRYYKYKTVPDGDVSLPHFITYNYSYSNFKITITMYIHTF